MCARAIPRRRKILRADIESAPTPTKIWPRRGQTVGRRKSVKKNAALLHFLAFSSNDHPFGVPRGLAPWAGVRCLGTAGLFSFPFLVTKKESLPEESLYKRGTPQGGVPRQGGGRQGVSRQIHTLKPAKHPGCLQLVAKFYKQLKITYLCNILNCFSSCRVLSTRVRTRWSTAQQCRGPARARTKLRSCLCAPGESCCFPAASRVRRFASSLH